jgi:hypothetical protein
MKKFLRVLYTGISAYPILFYGATATSNGVFFKPLLKRNQALLGITASSPDNWRISDAYLDKRNNINYVYVQQTFKGY